MIKTLLRIVLIGIASICIGFIAYLYIFPNTTYKPHIIIPETVCKDCNIILVSLDTLSANHLPCYGYDRDTAPGLCTFGKNNIFFENMYANATWTYPSHVSIFTGLYPHTHKVAKQGNQLAKTIPFLPSILQSAGYKTLFVLPSDDWGFSQENVYNRGIDTIYDETSMFSWSQPLNDFKSHVKNNQKTFLFLHTYAVHAPYLIGNKPQLYETKIIDTIPSSSKKIHEITNHTLQYMNDNIGNFISSGDFSKEQIKKFQLYKEFIDQHANDKTINLEYVKQFFFENPDIYNDVYILANYNSTIDEHNPEHMTYVKALYDQKIWELNTSYINEVIRFYNTNPEIQEKTILIFTADHGEEFMEHNQFGHITTYDSNLRVPLMMAVPNIKQTSIPIPVQSVDIMPTLLNLVGIPIPTPLDGVSLVSTMFGKTIADRMLVADGLYSKTQIIRWGTWKLFVHVGKKLTPYELYDYKNDPKEAKNIISSHFPLALEIIEQYQKNSKK